VTVEPRYVVTVRDGKDTMHRNPGEECNLDDSARDQEIDEFQFETALLRGDAVPCKHCLKDGWG
jgi:hypothetical protein